MRTPRAGGDRTARDERRLRELDRRRGQAAGSGGDSGEIIPVASLYQTAVQSIPNATPTVVRFDRAEVDSHGGWNGAGRYVAPRDGHYLASGSVLVFGTAGAKKVWLATSGGYVRASATHIAAAGVVDSYPATPAKVVRLLRGEWIELLCFQDSGSAQDTYADPATETGSGSGLDVAWIGPLTS